MCSESFPSHLQFDLLPLTSTPWSRLLLNHQVLDVTNLTFGGTTWLETQDHAKWAIGETSKTVCIGDINRQKSQASRGGGTVCRADAQLWQSFRSGVTGVQACSP